VTGETSDDGAIGYLLVARYLAQFDSIAQGLAKSGGKKKR